MAELDTSGGGKKGGKVRSKKASTRVDLTAMVDLAFLLITFFMLTTTLSKPQAMDLAMPDKEKNSEEQLKIADDRTMTILLGNNDRIIWYMGTVESASEVTTDVRFGKNGIRQDILRKLKEVKSATGKDLFIVIKPSAKSNYKNLVDILDEIKITDVKMYGIVDITSPEISGLLQAHGLY